MKHKICTLLALLPLAVSSAAEPWTLERCIAYAVTHNITVKQQEQQVEQRALQLSNARNQRLPDLNASAGQNFSFGRGLTAQNTYTNTNTSSTSFSVGTSVPLFTGFQIPNQIRLSKLNLEAATKDLERARNDLSLQVAQQYVQVLYDMEILAVARRQVSIDSAQVVRLQALLDVGRTSQAELSQVVATMAGSQLTVTQAEGNLQLSLLSLSQLLELPTPEGFAVCEPADELLNTALLAQHEVQSPDQIFAEAMGVRPEIQAEQLRLQGTLNSIKIAQAGLYPTLSFSAGLGTNYYTTSGFQAEGFGKQLKNNFSQYIGLNLSVPLFNRFQTRNSIRSARLDRTTQQLQLELAHKQLYNEIQQAYTSTVSARQKLLSSEEAERAMADAFALMQAKYEQGQSTITEFNEAKNNLLKAQSDLTQARYEYLYQTALIRFYRGQQLHF